MSSTSPGPLRPNDWRIGVWRAFLHAHAQVINALEKDLEGAGLPLNWYDVLLQLVEAPGRRLRMAELADRLLISRFGLTRMIDRLESEGFVRRTPSPDDARGTYTVLTREGFDALRMATPVHLAGCATIGWPTSPTTSCGSSARCCRGSVPSAATERRLAERAEGTERRLAERAEGTGATSCGASRRN